MRSSTTSARRMSRLDLFIRRMTAQRAAIEHAVEVIRDMPGSILEVGLGKGRTFDHLRLCCPDRRIWVFDRHVAAHRDAIPDRETLFLGEFAETVPAAYEKLGQTAALVHADFGSDDPRTTRELALWLGPWLARFTVSNGLVLSDQPLEAEGLEPVALPPGVEPGSYFAYRRRVAP
ncbi:class I SAM-dependent methyltransferase [Alsobacter sp. SYSU M60028]|uniref:Class I SAM-dependent methyltransferase n=1 Tax=Alsobacter ponti TaxID=2962936 RepID=A0ABT1LDC5_9HYPH|nr:class I SAM-dependent methyltransferase [Alsobacter ponti]MCP8939502.1 class I SAM-dependent methyltransferase [Alsobacter ponti]